MNNSIKKEYLNQILFNVAILLFFGVLFFTGTVLFLFRRKNL